MQKMTKFEQNLLVVCIAGYLDIANGVNVCRDPQAEDGQVIPERDGPLMRREKIQKESACTR